MKNKEEMFFDKISTVLKLICHDSIEEFTTLFYIKDSKASLEHRQTHLKTRWLNADNPTYPRLFKKEFSSYPFSRLSLKGKRLFKDANEFLTIKEEKFYERIKAYVEEDIILKSELDASKYYQYLYVYNINGIEENENIDYYNINYHDSISPNEIAISVNAPLHKATLQIKPYYGQLQQFKNRLILTFQNNDDYISAIFNTDLINNHSKYLIGMGVGIADINQKIPIAKKVILSKEEIEDLDELYLTLNESEILSAEENLYTYKYYNRDIMASHFDKYAKNIDKLYHLFSHLAEQNMYNNFYYQLGFKELSALNHIFQKLTHNQPYYINSRKRVVDILLKSHACEQYQRLYMVMPIYQDDNIFEHLSPQALQLQKELKELSSYIEIEIIFVIAHCKSQFSYEFMEFLEKFHKSINISFALKKNIVKEVNSIDFLFTDVGNFVVSKFLRVNTSVFNLYNEKSIVDEHKAMYHKIHNRSISYKEFLKEEENICQSQNPILKSLLGKWYFHLYGTQKLWIGEMSISKEGTVTVTSENGDIGKGEIIHKTHQSVILLEDIKTHRLVTVTFDHQPYKMAHAFTVQVISKQFKSDMEILTIGIVSRHKIKMENFQAILGDVDEVRVLEKESLQKRLNEYLGELFYL